MTAPVDWIAEARAFYKARPWIAKALAMGVPIHMNLDTRELAAAAIGRHLVGVSQPKARAAETSPLDAAITAGNKQRAVALATDMYRTGRISRADALKKLEVLG